MGNVPWNLFVLDLVRKLDSKSTLKQQEVFHYKNNRGYKKTGRAWTDHSSYRAEKKPEPGRKRRP